MELQTELNDVLADALSNGYQYIRSLKSNTTNGQTSRQKLAEAAARLLQLATDPKEYLEQLAANVR